MTKTIQIDWGKSEGSKYLKEAGEYIARLTSYEVDETEEGKPYIRWTIKVTEGKQAGATAKFVTSLSYKALWKLEELLDAIKYPIKRGSVQDLDLDDVIESGKDFAIEFIEGREREDGQGYYLQAEDFMSLDNLKEIEEAKPTEEKKEPLSSLEALIDEHDLDIDLEDYDNYDDAKKAIDKAIKGKANKPTKYTEEMIEVLLSKELNALADEIGLEFEEDASPRSKRRSLIKALKAAGRFEE